MSVSASKPAAPKPAAPIPATPAKPSGPIGSYPKRVCATPSVAKVVYDLR